MSDHTVHARAELARHLSTILLADTADLAKMRVLDGLHERGHLVDPATVSSVLDLYVQALKAVLAAAAPAPGPSVCWPLSGTQITFLRWASEGKSSGDIAIITGATRRTVDYHFAEILRKLGVSSRAQAIAWLAQADPALWSASFPDTAQRTRR